MEINKPEISVVVPFYNEQENIPRLYERLVKVMGDTGRSYELVFVNDGSRDESGKALDDIFSRDERLQVVHLRSNFGQTAALAAGFEQAQGEIIISMDGDLQHLPEEIPLFLEKIDEGYDIVSGWRKRRIDSLLVRRIPSRAANWMMARLSGMKLHDFGTTFKAYRKEVIKNIELYSDFHRFIPALASSMGVDVIEIPITNVDRESGKSNYGLSRIKKVIFDLLIVKFLISFLDRPLQIFGLIGLIFAFLGVLVGGTLSVMYFMDMIEMREHLGNLMLSVTLTLIGMNFISLGLLAEISSRIYFKVHSKKPYSVRRIRDHKN